MSRYNTQPEESNRLKALFRYEVLDSSQEPEFDKITRLVADYFRVPMVALGFVESTRVWYKSRFGIELSELSLEEALCIGAVFQKEAFFVSNAQANPAFSSNLLVSGPAGVRSFAVAPLITPSGYAVGSLTIMDTTPRSITEKEMSSLAIFAQLVIDILEGQLSSKAKITNLYDAKLEEFPGLLWFTDEHGLATYFNKTWLNFTGRSLAQELGTGWADSVHPADVKNCLDTIYNAFLGKTELEVKYRLRRNDGEYRLMVCMGKPFNRPDGSFGGYTGFAKDITEQERNLEELKLSEELYRTLARNFQGASILLFDHDFRYILVEGTMINEIGYTKEDLEGKTIYEALPQASIEYLEPYYKAALAGTISNFEFSLPNKTYYYSQIVPVKNDKGKIFAGLVISQNVTQLKNTEAVLAAEKELLLTTLGAIGDGVITTNNQGRITLLNKAAADLTGWQENEALGQDLSRVFSPEPLKEQSAPAEFLLTSRDGHEHTISQTLNPILDKEGHPLGTVAVFRDITGRIKSEEELFKVRKLESLGVLAGGIAHDFNNLLTAVLSNLSLAKLYYTPESEETDILEGAEKASLQAKELTQQLLTFARGGAPVKQTALLPGIIEESATFASRGSGVLCSFELAEDLWPIEVDKSQLSQVIQNLIFNAKESIISGGNIKVTATNVILENEKVLPLIRGKYVLISITDNGTGISPENLPKIFDPFYTTKQGKSGLGLSICYSIIQKHDGHIRVESKIGVGTTVKVYLPVKQSNNPTPSNYSNNTSPSLGRILLMDDEQIILNSATRVLKHLGYEVEISRSGEEALFIYQREMESDRPFNLVIMDLTIPGGMGGKEAIARLLKLDPTARAVVSSGYSVDPVMANYRDYGFIGVLAKPYSVIEMKKLMNELMGS